MSIRTDRRTIDGLDVTVTQLPAMRALALFTRLGKVIGPSLGKLLGVVQGPLATTSYESLVPAIAGVFTSLDNGEAESLTQEILRQTSITQNGRIETLDRTEMIDLVFNGRLKTLFSVILFTLEVNYSDFLTGLSGGQSSDESQPKDKPSTLIHTSRRRGQRGVSG